MGITSQERLEQITGVSRDLATVKDMKRDWPKEKKTERGYSRQAGKRLLSRGNKRVCSLLLLDMTRSNRLQLQKRRQILDLRKVLKITEH